VTISLRDSGVRSVVLDIEGTTTPISFVTDVLFPYVRSHLRPFLTARFGVPELQEVLRTLQAEWAYDAALGGDPPLLEDSPPLARLESMAAYVDWLMDRDRKSSGLKRLQGMIWKGGYENATLRGDVYPDVVRALERWHIGRVDVAIYSSGSELAQRLLFGSTSAGDLTPLIRFFFDTTLGPKTASDSYAHIAEVMGRPCGELLFVSDVVAELDAASETGVPSLRCLRPGNAAQPPNDYAVIESFDEIVA
jgi:enolase-phosphatase E1